MSRRGGGRTESSGVQGRYFRDQVVQGHPEVVLDDSLVFGVRPVQNTANIAFWDRLSVLGRVAKVGFPR